MRWLHSIRLSPKQLEERRLAAHKMLRDGRTQAEVARELGVTSGAVAHWVKAMETGGKDALKRRPHTGRPPRLKKKQRERLAEMLVEGAEAHGFENDVWTLERVATLIEGEFGVAYHPGHVFKILERLGFSWKKPLKRPINRDEEAIRQWVAQEWPRLKKGPRSSAP
jgi:transposase